MKDNAKANRILARYLYFHCLMVSKWVKLLMLLEDCQNLLKVKNSQTNQIYLQNHRSLVSFMAVLGQTNHLHQKLLKELVVSTNYLVCQNLKSAKPANYQPQSLTAAYFNLVVCC